MTWHTIIFLLVLFFDKGLSSSSSPNFFPNLTSFERAKRDDEISQTAPRQILIGAVFEIGEEVQEIALKEAVAAANLLIKNSNNLAHTVFVFEIRRVPAFDTFSIAQEVCVLLQKGVVALFSPSDHEASLVVQSIADKFAIPYIQTHFQPVVTSPYNLNLNPTQLIFGKALFDYIGHYGMPTKIGLIYEKQIDLLKYKTFFENYSGHMIMRKWFSEDINYAHILKEMRSKNILNFIVDLPYWKSLELLHVASQLGMTTEYNKYTFTAMDTELISFQWFMCNISIISMMPQVGHLRDGNNLINNFRQKVFDIEKANHGATGLAIPIRAALVYDGVTLLIQALEALGQSRDIQSQSLECHHQKFWQHGHALINYITSLSTVQGITGDISLDNTGQRTNVTIYFHKFQLSHGYTKAATWSELSGIVITKNFSHSEAQVLAANRVIKVTTKDESPFVMIVKRDKHGNPLTDISGWSGFCMELLKEIAKHSNITFSIHLVRDNNYGGPNGSRNSDGSEQWNGMIGELMDHSRDLAVSSLTITYERAKVIDFTTPYMNLGLSILYKKLPPKPPDLFQFLKPLHVSVWGYMFTAYFTVSFVLFLVARFTPLEWKSKYPCEESEELQNKFNITNSMWFAIGSLFQQGCDILPVAISTRLLGVTWWFFSLILISSYTANLAAFLTVSRMKLPITDAKDLSKQTDIKYGTLKDGSASFAFFKNSKFEVYETMYNFMKNNARDCLVNSTKEGITRVLNKNINYAFILESTQNEYYRARNCDLYQVGDLLDNKGYGFGLPRGSPYRDLITESILFLEKNQIIDKLKQDWWYKYNMTNWSDKNGNNHIGCPKEVDEFNPSLGVEQVGGVFVFLMLGIATSIPVALIEFIYRRSQHRITKDSMCIMILRELRFAFTCFGSSKRLKIRPAGCTRKTPLNKGTNSTIRSTHGSDGAHASDNAKELVLAREQIRLRSQKLKGSSRYFQSQPFLNITDSVDNSLQELHQVQNTVSTLTSANAQASSSHHYNAIHTARHSPHYKRQPRSVTNSEGALNNAPPNYRQATQPNNEIYA